MIHDINGTRVAKLGDPHLGRAFVKDVPLHRRGDREKMVWSDFEKSLASAKDADFHVCMGDLFDKMVVPYDVILRAAELYLHYAARFPGVIFVILRGNHDASRDSDKHSAFDIFEAIVASQKNIIVVKDEPISMHGLLFVPWHPFKNAREMIADQIENHDAVFGHWDIERFPGANPNLLPAETLIKITKRIFTGHVHTPQETHVGDALLTVTGSMQPYAHGEDPSGEFYMTIGIDQVMECLNSDPLFFKDVCLRIDAHRGDEIPQIDCLQLKVRYVGEIEQEDVDVGFLNFDMTRIFDDSMIEGGVSPPIVAKIRERFNALRLS